MAVTTSLHSGSSVSIKHNVRDDSVVSKEEHIMPGGEHASVGVGCNGRTLRDAYDDIFGEATKAYNAKQKRADRKISSYYDKMKAEAEKGAKSGNKNAKKLVYESIMTIGEYRNYNQDFADSFEQIDSKMARRILTESLEKIAKEHKHIKIVGVYFHGDEYHDEMINGEKKHMRGALHLHFDWIPVADGFKRGLAVQNSLDRALTQDGYKTTSIKDTAQMQFQAHCLEIIDEVARGYGLEITHPVVEGRAEKRGHLEKADYILSQKEQLVEPVRAEKEALQREVKQLNSAVNKRQKKVSKLEEQATKIENDVAWKTAELVANQQRIAELDEDIEKRKRKRSELENEVQGLTVHADSIKALESEIKDAKEAYDVAVQQKDEDVKAIENAFTDAKKVGFGKNKGLMQIAISEGTYTRFLTMARNVGVFEHAYDAVSGLESRIQGVLDTAKNYYKKAQTVLQEAKETLLQAHKVASGEAYKAEEKKLADLLRKKKSLSRDVDDLEYKRESLSYDCDDLQEAKEALLRDVKDIQVTRYEKAYIKRYRDDFDDFVKEQRNRERSYDDWER